MALRARFFMRIFHIGAMDTCREATAPSSALSETCRGPSIRPLWADKAPAMRVLAVHVGQHQRCVLMTRTVILRPKVCSKLMFACTYVRLGHSIRTYILYVTILSAPAQSCTWNICAHASSHRAICLFACDVIHVLLTIHIISVPHNTAPGFRTLLTVEDAIPRARVSTDLTHEDWQSEKNSWDR